MICLGKLELHKLRGFMKMFALQTVNAPIAQFYIYFPYLRPSGLSVA